jgi:YVTN family beta-propeller protein
VAFANALHKGYTSNGRANSVTVFDLASNKVLGTVPTGENPDAITWEPYTKTVITCNGRSKDLSIIDPVEDKVIATIPVGGKPETAVSDGKGRMFVNIEDKNEIVVVDLKARNVTQHWPLAPGTAPSGLAIDVRTNRLFAACDNKLLVVLDAASGNVVDKLPIGDGCDGDAFDEKSQLIITSNGEGTLTVIHENNANSFTVEGNYPTKRGARTIAIDQKTGLVFLPTADFQPAEQGARPRPVPGSFQILVVGR